MASIAGCAANSYVGSGVTNVAGQLLTGMSNTHEMIAKAEDILWPARRAIAQVAILFPQSATYWDLLGMKTGAIIKDATNHNLESACPEQTPRPALCGPRS